MATKMLMTVEKMQDREEWLKVRGLGLGGSDAGTVLGINKWKSPFTLWLEKTGQKEPDDLSNNEYIYWGSVLEQAVADRFCELTGKKVRKQGLVQSIEHPFMLASVDRMVVGEDAGLECKTANGFAAKEWEGDNIPDSYLAQCAHYMAVTGCKKWYIACLIGGNHFVWKEIDRNEDDIKMLIEAEERFWQMVQDGTMPEVDSSDDCYKALSNKFRGGKEEALSFNAEAQDALDAYLKAKELVDTFTKQLNEAKNRMCLAMGDYETAYSGEHKVSWKTSAGRTTLDSKKLKADHPDIYEQYSKVGKPVRTFKVN